MHERIKKMIERKNYVTPEMIRLAKNQDVFDILVRDGVPMTHSNGIYRLREHDSLVITPSKGFYWFSQGYGSRNPIMFYMKVYGLEFVKAVYHVLDVINLDYTHMSIDDLKRNKEKAKKLDDKKEFILSEKADNNRKVFAYLTKTRCIDRELVNKLIEQGSLYQDDKYGNVVFLGKDYDGNVRSAFRRTTFTGDDLSFKSSEQVGSKKEYRFRIENENSSIVNVFESEIDLLSYITMRKDYDTEENYLSLGGVSEKALEAFLENRQDIQEINICTDNDLKGHEFYGKVIEDYGDRYLVTREIPVNKDFNEDLVKGERYRERRNEVKAFTKDEEFEF